MQHIATPMSLSVLGCVVNGPGEARETDIGITGGGNGKHMVYLSGVTDHHVQDEEMIDHIVRLVEAKAAEIEAGSAPARRGGIGRRRYREPRTLMVSASTPRLKKKPATQWAVTTLRICGEVIATSEVCTATPSVKAK